MRKSLKNFKTTEADEKQAQNLYNKYGSMSEDALFSNLMQEVASAKSKGSFSSGELRANVEKMKPFLSAEQFEKLNHLLRLIGS